MSRYKPTGRPRGRPRKKGKASGKAPLLSSAPATAQDPPSPASDGDDDAKSARKTPDNDKMDVDADTSSLDESTPTPNDMDEDKPTAGDEDTASSDSKDAATTAATPLDGPAATATATPANASTISATKDTSAAKDITRSRKARTQLVKNAAKRADRAAGATAAACATGTTGTAADASGHVGPPGAQAIVPAPSGATGSVPRLVLRAIAPATSAPATAPAAPSVRTQHGSAGNAASASANAANVAARGSGATSDGATLTTGARSIVVRPMLDHLLGLPSAPDSRSQRQNEERGSKSKQDESKDGAQTAPKARLEMPVPRPYTGPNQGQQAGPVSQWYSHRRLPDPIPAGRPAPQAVLRTPATALIGGPISAPIGAPLSAPSTAPIAGPASARPSSFDGSLVPVPQPRPVLPPAAHLAAYANNAPQVYPHDGRLNGQETFRYVPIDVHAHQDRLRQHQLQGQDEGHPRIYWHDTPTPGLQQQRPRGRDYEREHAREQRFWAFTQGEPALIARTDTSAGTGPFTATEHGPVTVTADGTEPVAVWFARTPSHNGHYDGHDDGQDGGRGDGHSNIGMRDGARRAGAHYAGDHAGARYADHAEHHNDAHDVGHRVRHAAHRHLRGERYQAQGGDHRHAAPADHGGDHYHDAAYTRASYDPYVGRRVNHDRGRYDGRHGHTTAPAHATHDRIAAPTSFVQRAAPDRGAPSNSVRNTSHAHDNANPHLAHPTFHRDVETTRRSTGPAPHVATAVTRPATPIAAAYTEPAHHARQAAHPDDFGFTGLANPAQHQHQMHQMHQAQPPVPYVPYLYNTITPPHYNARQARHAAHAARGGYQGGNQDEGRHQGEGRRRISDGSTTLQPAEWEEGEEIEVEESEREGSVTPYETEVESEPESEPVSEAEPEPEPEPESEAEQDGDGYDSDGDGYGDGGGRDGSGGSGGSGGYGGGYGGGSGGSAGSGGGGGSYSDAGGRYHNGQGNGDYTGSQSSPESEYTDLRGDDYALTSANPLLIPSNPKQPHQALDAVGYTPLYPPSYLFPSTLFPSPLFSMQQARYSHNYSRMMDLVNMYPKLSGSLIIVLPSITRAIMSQQVEYEPEQVHQIDSTIHASLLHTLLLEVEQPVQLHYDSHRYANWRREGKAEGFDNFPGAWVRITADGYREMTARYRAEARRKRMEREEMELELEVGSRKKVNEGERVERKERKERRLGLGAIVRERREEQRRMLYPRAVKV